MKYIIYIVGTLGLSASLVLGYINYNDQEKYAFIEGGVVFSEFTGKIEIEEGFTEDKNKQKGLLDSLSLKLLNIKNQVTPSLSEIEKDSIIKLFYSERENFERLSKEFENYNRVKEEEYVAEIWTQLNQYIIDYGKENNYKFIFGANGSGSMMYGEDELNITDEVVKYVNKRYEGE